MKMHLDGARCLNAAAYLKISPAKMTKDFDTVTNLLGHTDMGFTRDKYVHWFKDEEKAEKIREAIATNIVSL